MDKKFDGTSAMFEQLEPRLLLNGNVDAMVVGGTLVVGGDANSNAITITQEGANFVITGDGTTVNGGAAPAVFAGVTKGFKMFMGLGNDTLTMTHLALPSRVQIRTGLGDDATTIDGCSTTGEVAIDTSWGADTLSVLDSQLLGNVRLLTGIGNDTVELASQFGAAGVPRSKFLLNTGLGNDTLTVISEGDDSSFYGQTTIFTGWGCDTVTLTNETFHAAFYLNLGVGDDTVNMSGITVGEFTVLDGGHGLFDTLNDLGGNTGDPIALHFELFRHG